MQEELVRAGVLSADYDFEGHRELIGMQLGDVPVTNVDSSRLEEGRLNAVWNYLYKIADIDEINRVKEKYNNTEEIIKNMLKLNQLLDDMEDYPEDTDKPEYQPTSSSGLSAI